MRERNRAGLRSRKNKRSRSRFSYKPRTREELEKRAHQQGGAREGVLLPGTKEFRPPVGDSCIRICPPTWDDPEHFGLEIYQHYGVGPDQSTFICPKHTKLPGDGGEPLGDCPICEEGALAKAEGDEEYEKALRPNKRVLYYVIDRTKQREGPQVWSASWTIDRDLSAQSIDKKTGEVICLDDPEDGYDVDFERTGTGKTNTKYVGLSISRRSSHLGRDADDWLEEIIKTPLTEVLNIKDYDELQKAFEGGANVRNSLKENEEEEEGGGRRESKHKRGGGSRRRGDVHQYDLEEMDYDEMCDLIDKLRLDIDYDDYDPDDDEDVDDLANDVMKMLKQKEHEDEEEDEDDKFRRMKQRGKR